MAMDRSKSSRELGFMIIAENGRLADSGGQLKNDEKFAAILNQIKNTLDISYHVLKGTAHSMTIQYDNHMYVLVFEPRRSVIAKIGLQTSDV